MEKDIDKPGSWFPCRELPVRYLLRNSFSILGCSNGALPICFEEVKKLPASRVDMPVKLAEIKLGKDKKLELLGWACEKFRKSVEARTNQIDNDYKRWVDNYAAKPQQAIRTTPYYKASNFVPRLIAMHTDIMGARMVGLLFGTRPFWRPSTFAEKISNEQLMATGEWMHKKCQYDINFYDPIDLGIFLTVKTGFHVIKNNWVHDVRTRANADGAATTSEKEGLVLDNIPFSDLYPYPVTCQWLHQCEAIFHRLRFTKEQVQFRKNIKFWSDKGADLVLRGADAPTTSAEQSNAQIAGISLTKDVVRPFNVIEAWTQYELEPGKLSDIVLTFNPYQDKDESGILKLYYNYLPDDLDPFVDFKIMPREGLIVGDCVPNILEQSQEEQAQIHNARRDGNLISTVPGWKKKKYADGLGAAIEWYPGKVFELDNMDDLEPLQFGREYNSLIDEEMALLQLSERYTGISPAQQGFGSGQMGKKGIYANSATLALLSEGNKRLDIYLQRLRRVFHKQGRLIFTHYRDFGSKGLEWDSYGEGGKLVKQVFELREPKDFRGIFFDLGASDASANKEVDRQNLLLMSNTMSAYYKEIMALAPQIASMPDGSPAKELSLQVLDGARDLANRILFVFDVWDRKKLVPNVREMLGGNKPPPPSATAQQAGVPEADEPLSDERLQTMAGTIEKVQASQRPGANGSAPVNGQGERAAR